MMATLINNIDYKNLENKALHFGEILLQYNNYKMFEVSYDEEKEDIYYFKSNKSIAPHMAWS